MSLRRSLSRGLRTGLAVSCPIPLAVGLSAALPEIQLGYPLFLMPLLLAGPLAVRWLPLPTASLAALIAGLVSAVVAALSLAVGSQVLGTGVWALVGPLSNPPVTSIPRAGVLPMSLMTWAQQDLLLVQPVLALLLGTLVAVPRVPRLRRGSRQVGRLLPHSVGGRLGLTFGVLTALTLLVGWVGFTSLEDMHFRGHRVQLQARWLWHLAQARAAFDQEYLAYATGADATIPSAAVGVHLDQLTNAPTYAGVSVNAAKVSAARAGYLPLARSVTDALVAYRLQPADAHAADGVRLALNELADRLDVDTLSLVDTDDVTHHQRLFAVLVVLCLAGLVALLVGRRAISDITAPVVELGRHLLLVAGGDFTGRVRVEGPRELEELGTAVNRMTADLERLYALERTAFEQQLWHQAFHDPLTGLPNRALFTDRLRQALARAAHAERSVAVLFFDLDNFKVVNDSLGHQQGDLLLLDVAERLRACIHADGTAARLGGDEFTVLLEDVRDASDAVGAAERILLMLGDPASVGGRDVFITASVGIAVSGDQLIAPEDLLRSADLAMYRAKANGRARWEIFDRSMELRAVERLELETDLRRALDRGEFRVFYQPILALESGQLVEVEALVRWQHPERGLVAPADFIPLAEETGLIVALGQHVLAEACRQARVWDRQFPHLTPLVVSVNLSARQFQSPDLVLDIARTVRESGLDPRRLKLEITESVVMQDVDAAAATLRDLKRLGIQLAIDDFGTGYSSLTYLKRFPVDALKIDRSFVDGVGEDPHDTAIVRGVVSLAKTLNLSVTGEGIETQAQHAHLVAEGCDRGQGYLFARPLPPTELEPMFRQRDETRRAAA